MKKFLSLLLALTMVLSLVVVPARAGEKAPEVGGELSITVPSSITKGDENVSFTLAGNPTLLNVANATEVTPTYSWNIGSYLDGTAGNGNPTNNLTAKAATTGTTVSCTVRITYKVDGESKSVERTVTSASFPIADAILDSDITSVSFKGRNYSYASGTAAVLYDAAEASALEDAKNWGVNAAGVTVDTVNVSGSSVTLNLKKGDLTKSITVTASKLTAPSITAHPATGAKTGTKVTFTLNATTSDNTRITWTYKADKVAEAPFFPTKGSAANTYEWMLPDSLETKTYTITCSLSESGAANTAVSKSVGISVSKDTNKFNYNPNVAATRGSTVTLSLSFTDGSGKKVDNALTNVDWKITSGTGASLGTKAVSDDGKTASNTLTIPSNASSSYTVAAKFTVDKKDYVATYTVTVKSLTAAISPIQNNTAVTLYGYNYGYNYGYGTTNNLVALAQTALSTARIDATVSYVTLDTIAGSRTNCYIQQTSSTSGYYTYAITGTSIGTASFTGTVYTNKGNYPITFTATVTPISTTYEAQYPEPVASYGNTYKYYVQVPAGASYYYVVGTPNQSTTPTDFTQSGKTVYYATTQSASLYALTDANFVNGQCTLWIVTKNSTDNKLYYGQLTVYQKNYNINYNGVAGETVQFKHADFTNFMNEIAQARGDSSKNNNYNNTYVTFNDVTFSMPSSAQGTLYYNGVAMSNSSYSGSFNSRTQISNLDAITFVPNAKTSAKSITLSFTLHATKYANGRVVSNNLSYPGSVVISIVREDIKYTVAPGDSISFTSSDFQNFLRTQSGINYNHNVDYVTFDQSAVNSLNEGVLYNGYSGFSAVKATDKFYYTTTSSYTQNALSDVTFRASTYAKAGTTVYVPFTIYAKYGTSSAATRQVTGTVAIKIAQTMNFADVKPTDYFYNPVKWAVNKNITKGTSATTFSPYKTCTRAEIVTFLWRDAGSPMPTTSRHPFTDVSYSMGSDFYNAILWANQMGITAGTTTTTFSPNKTCTRAEIVTFLWRYAKKPVGYGSNNPFTDVNKTDHAPYYDAILWAVSKGITTGSTTTTFSPNGTCTRGEAVTFLYRFEGGK